MVRLSFVLDIETSTKLNLYAALTHQTQQEAAQEILADWLNTTGEVRMHYRVEKKLDEIDALVSRKSHQAPVLKIS